MMYFGRHVLMIYFGYVLWMTSIMVKSYVYKLI